MHRKTIAISVVAVVVLVIQGTSSGTWDIDSPTPTSKLKADVDVYASGNGENDHYATLRICERDNQINVYGAMTDQTITTGVWEIGFGETSPISPPSGGFPTGPAEAYLFSYDPEEMSHHVSQ